MPLYSLGQCVTIWILLVRAKLSCFVRVVHSNFPGNHDDDQCLDALHRVHLLSKDAHDSQRTSCQPSREPSTLGFEGEDATDTNRNITLDTQVSAGGNNFSQGQRQ